MTSLMSDARLAVSSVLNRDVKLFGKQYLTDQDPETSWNSDQGSPQSVSVQFGRAVLLHTLLLQFQGGFAAAECWLEAGSVARDLTRRHNIYPEDVNALQTFQVNVAEPVTHVRLVFNSSTDFFGRIVLYKLDFQGEWIDT